MIEQSYTLAQLTSSIATQVAKLYSGSYWIRAELNKLNYFPQSGHCYPQLVEKKDGKIVAEMRGFIHRHQYRELAQQFTQATGSPLSDGMQILFQCKLRFHPLHGLSLDILRIDGTYTLGEMARLKLQARQKLKALGLYRLNQNLRLPALVKRIAILSLETSKGYADFIHLVNQSPYVSAFSLRLIPTLLQGDAAVPRIVAGLKQAAASPEPFHAVCIIRGGGSDTGLDCFDHFAVAEAIAQCPVPVLTGIGHATNTTLAEEVAHHSKLTPTDLAAFLISRMSAAEQELHRHALVLLQVAKAGFRQSANSLHYLAHIVLKDSPRRLLSERHALQNLMWAIRSSTPQRLQGESLQLSHVFLGELKRTGLQRLHTQKALLQQGCSAMLQGAERTLTAQDELLKQLEQQLHLLAPEKILARGYSIVRREGRALSHASELSSNQQIHITFASGSATANINTITDT